MNILYSNINKSNSKPGILSLVPEFSDMYVLVTSLPEFPHPLPQLYDPNNLKLEYHELLEKCESIFVDATQNMAVSVEKASSLNMNQVFGLSIMQEGLLPPK